MHAKHKKEEAMLEVITQTITKIEDTSNMIAKTYDTYIREKAIEIVNAKLEENKIDITKVENNDYEAMVNDSCKDIKEKYSKRSSQGLMVIMGIDFLLG